LNGWLDEGIFGKEKSPNSFERGKIIQKILVKKITPLPKFCYIRKNKEDGEKEEKNERGEKNEEEEL
jgi:hypothetical protein